MTRIDSSGLTRTAGLGKPGQRSAEQLAVIERRLDRLERARGHRAQFAFDAVTTETQLGPSTTDTSSGPSVSVSTMVGQIITVGVFGSLHKGSGMASSTVNLADDKAIDASNGSAASVLVTTNNNYEFRLALPGSTTGITATALPTSGFPIPVFGHNGFGGQIMYRASSTGTRTVSLQYVTPAGGGTNAAFTDMYLWVEVRGPTG